VQPVQAVLVILQVAQPPCQSWQIPLISTSSESQLDVHVPSFRKNVPTQVMHVTTVPEHVAQGLVHLSHPLAVEF
jgi:hypothetical protein